MDMAVFVLHPFEHPNSQSIGYSNASGLSIGYVYTTDFGVVVDIKRNKDEVR